MKTFHEKLSKNTDPLDFKYKKSSCQQYIKVISNIQVTIRVVIRRQRKSIGNMLSEKQDLNSLKLRRKLKEKSIVINGETPPPSGFSQQLLTIET